VQDQACHHLTLAGVMGWDSLNLFAAWALSSHAAASAAVGGEMAVAIAMASKHLGSAMTAAEA